MAKSRFSRSPAVACGGGSVRPCARASSATGPASVGAGDTAGGAGRFGVDRGTLARSVAWRGRAARSASCRTTAARRSGGPSTSAVSPRPTTQSTNALCSGTTIRRRTTPDGSQASTDPAPSVATTLRASRASTTIVTSTGGGPQPSASSPHGPAGLPPTCQGRKRTASRRSNPAGSSKAADLPRPGVSSKRSTRNVRSPASGAVLSRPTRYQAVNLNVSPYGSTSRRRPR